MIDIYEGFVWWLILWLPEWNYLVDVLHEKYPDSRINLFWDCITEDRIDETPWSCPDCVIDEMDQLRDKNRIKVLMRRVNMRLDSIKR